MLKSCFNKINPLAKSQLRSYEISKIEIKKIEKVSKIYDLRSHKDAKFFNEVRFLRS
jgi:hypothetical protein